MKYKMIEIGSGWVLERFDEEYNEYKMYDFSDGEWYTSIWSNTIKPKEVVLKKYNELVLESTIDANVNQYRQKVEDHFNAGGMCEWADRYYIEDGSAWTDYSGQDGWNSLDFNWQTFNYRIKEITLSDDNLEQQSRSEVEKAHRDGFELEWIPLDFYSGQPDLKNHQWDQFAIEEELERNGFQWRNYNYRIKDEGDVNEVVNNSIVVNQSMSKRDMIFSEYQRITDNCVQCDSVMTRHERLELAINTVDLIIKESENG